MALAWASSFVRHDTEKGFCRRAFFLGPVILLAFPVADCFSSALGAEMQPGVHSVGNRRFAVYARGSDAAMYTNRLSYAVAKSLNRFFPPTESSREIEVHLVDRVAWRYPGPFQTLVSGAGDVSVHVLSSSETEKHELMRALVQSCLLNWKLNTGVSDGRMRLPDEQVRVPRWLEYALVAQVRAELNPAFRAHLAETAERFKPVYLKTLLGSAGDSEPEMFALSAYWFFQTMRAECRSLGKFRGVLAEFLMESDGPGQLEAAVLGAGVESDLLELWWRVGYYQTSFASRSASLSITRSRALIVRRATFIFSRDHRDLAVPLGVLPESAENPIVREVLRARLFTIAKELPEVNPIYHNAYLALGRILEGILEAEDLEAKQLLALFRADMESADRMASRIAGLIE